LLQKIEQKMVTMMRNVKVNSELYTFLLNKSQELKVAEAGTVGNVRIIDFALKPYRPVKPKKSMIVALGFMLGLFFGVLLVFVRKAMNQGIEDPDLAERITGLSVFAGVPHSELQNKLHGKMKESKGEDEDCLLASVDNTDLAVESLRSLRTNLHFALMEAKGNIVMLTGPAPGLGKSFVSANFGAVLAGTGQKILLIDGDMRKGHLHEYFQTSREPGLSGLISGTVTVEEAIQETSVENLYLLPTGVLPPNPADLLMSQKFDAALDILVDQFDLILMDTPPVLAVTDALLIGRRASVSFMLLRSGKHPKREIEQAIKHVENAGISLSGLIFNDIIPKASGYRYGTYHYQYDYTSDKD
jgi:tyrosine-protein kinase Etk/Wzc